MQEQNIFRTYYQRWIIVFSLIYLIVMAVRVFQGYGLGDTAFKTFLAFMGMALFMGALAHIYNMHYKMRRLNTLLSRFTDLEQLGLKREGYVYAGNYQGYYIMAIPMMGMFSGESLSFSILIMPTQQQIEQLAETSSGFDLIPGEEYYTVRVLVPLPLGRLPKMEKIVEKLDSVISILQQYRVETVVFTDAE